LKPGTYNGAFVFPFATKPHSRQKKEGKSAYSTTSWLRDSSTVGFPAFHAGLLIFNPFGILPQVYNENHYLKTIVLLTSTFPSEKNGIIRGKKRETKTVWL